MLTTFANDGMKDVAMARCCFVRLPIEAIRAEPAFCANSLPNCAAPNRSLVRRFKRSLPSPRFLNVWLLGRKYQTNHAPEYRAQVVETLRRGCPPIASAQRLANDFVTMLAERQQSALPGWIQKARASGLREMRVFADGLERDMEPVQAAAGTRYSNGIVNCHVNRLKRIKRQMYGRASLALLRIRVLRGSRNAAYVT
jgi:transposase